MSSAIALDKYYTKTPIARQCYEMMKPFIPAGSVYIEPSAGGGAFLEAIGDDAEIIGFDIAPESPFVIEKDYLATDVRAYLSDLGLNMDGKSVVCIGNPPFGTKGKLAVKFINKALDEFGTVGFILPVQFRKWSGQKRLESGARLILDETIPEDSFEIEGKTYKVRCCFQIWSVDHPQLPDLRIRTKPVTKHPDFEMYQFNRTLEAEKFFDYDWNFAVPRQGYQDYTFKAYKPEECDRKKQWIFFKTDDEEVLDRLLKLDFTQLSLKNTGIPGFGKADVIEAYEKY